MTKTNKRLKIKTIDNKRNKEYFLSKKALFQEKIFAELELKKKGENEEGWGNKENKKSNKRLKFKTFNDKGNNKYFMIKTLFLEKCFRKLEIDKEKEKKETKETKERIKNEISSQLLLKLNNDFNNDMQLSTMM